MLVMKSGKRYLTDGTELPNQDKIRTLGEKETYKYWDKQAEMKKKKKFKKNISGELENYSRQTSLAETLSKE